MLDAGTKVAPSYFILADFEDKGPGMVNTHLPLNMMNLFIKEMECDTCDGSPRRSETFLPVLAFE